MFSNSIEKGKEKGKKEIEIEKFAISNDLNLD